MDKRFLTLKSKSQPEENITTPTGMACTINREIRRALGWVGKDGPKGGKVV